jgi:serine/threonine protein kinase
VAALADTPDEHRDAETGHEIPVAEKPAAGELASAGRRLGGRYRLERMVRGFGGGFEPEPELWVGVDELLNRKVGVDLIATSHPLCEKVARAARNAAAVPDARFVQVLDAVQDEDLLYIVTEWVPGAEQLQDRLASGPLSPASAGAMIRDLVQAMVKAHEVEIPHGALNPATVMITAAGEVKLRGVLVEATLGGTDPQAAEPEERYAADVLALGQIWYAALTARWPGPDAEYGLEAAPADNGVPYSCRVRRCPPAQIRAAVPKQVDEVVCRALGLGDEGERITTAKELADLVSALPRLREEAVEPTSVLPRDRVAAPPPTRSRSAAPDPQWGGPHTTVISSRTPVWRRPGVLAVAGCAVVALATLAAFQFGGSNKNDAGSLTTVDGSTPHPVNGGTLTIPPGQTGGPLPIKTASVWDEDATAASVNAAPNAINPASTTGWQTSTQDKNASFQGTYPGGSGIGLVFDLGAVHSVDQVKFQVGTPGATIEVLTGGSGANGSPTWSDTNGPAGYTVQSTQQVSTANTDVTVNFSQVDTEYVMIVFTTLPYQGAGTDGTPPGYRDQLIDVRAYGV